MRILLTNDDGIFAPGLAALREAVADLGDVTVVAPDSPQSAVGRAITLGEAIPCEHVHVDGEYWGFAVGGRPVDCVKIAIHELTDPPPSLVLSGINAGSNPGINVFYSGTVAAAAEGALYGIPSVAFSMTVGDEMDFHRAGRLCRWVLDGLLAAPLTGGQLVSVNLPALSDDTPRGIKVVPQSTAAITEKYIRTVRPDGKKLFQLGDFYEHGPQDGETDVTALAEGYITVTPLHADLTDHAHLAKLRHNPWPDMPK